MKNIKTLIVLLICIAVPIFVNAADNGMTSVKTEEALISCLDSGDLCRLDSNIRLSNSLTITKNAYLDLNGHSLTPESNMKRNGGFIIINRGGNLVVRDNKNTGVISTGAKDNSNVWGAIQLINDEANSNQTAELTVESGTIEGYYYGIVGNGNRHNTKVTINGGTILGLNDDDSVGIYHPQIGSLTVNGGTIKGGTGIEMRSGSLVINDGTIEATSPKFVKVVTSGGSTTNGVGVSVAQHTTKNAIDVNINGGNISGQYAFYEWNPHGNAKASLDKITLKISGGNFTGTANGVSTVYSEDFTNFISGGKFNKSVSKYLTSDAKVASKTVDENDSQKEENSQKKSTVWVIILIVLLTVGVIAGSIFYKKMH